MNAHSVRDEPEQHRVPARLASVGARGFKQNVMHQGFTRSGYCLHKDIEVLWLLHDLVSACKRELF